MKLPQKYLWLLGLTLAVIISLTLFLAPQNSKLTSGSTYNRAPDGYGAWYAFMEKQGTPIKRWQKPIQDLPKSKNSVTLLRVSSDVADERDYYFNADEWVARGNTLVILGVAKPATEAAFTTSQESEVGKVKIETRRRKTELSKKEKQRLGDDFGAIVWEQKVGKGKFIYSSTPYLAANAYQDEPGNYKFLAKLVTEGSKSVLVDEYIHGYKDKEVIQKEGKASWIDYLAKTPLASIFVQAGVILVVLVVAKNRRFGQAVSLKSPVVDNTEAYIQALAAVLRKANSSEFVVEAIGKEEKMQLQKELGLGTTPADNQTAIETWVKQTGRPASELEQVLHLQSKKNRISEKSLLNWLEKWQKIRNPSKT